MLRGACCHFGGQEAYARRLAPARPACSACTLTARGKEREGEKAGVNAIEAVVAYRMDGPIMRVDIISKRPVRPSVVHQPCMHVRTHVRTHAHTHTERERIPSCVLLPPAYRSEGFSPLPPNAGLSRD